MDTKVIDSRVIEDWEVIRRRRECEFCKYRFTTFERRTLTELLVIKKDWTKEVYDRQKLKHALMLAFAKRKFDQDEIETLINNLEMQWSVDGTEVSSSQIWDDILQVLKGMDPVAYVRFASVYMSFKDLVDFRKFVD